MEKCNDNERIPPVVELNVGGQRYTTLLSTLRSHPDSMLAAMFSGRHTIERDKNGCYFIDVDGTYFEHILKYLRHRTLPPLEACLPVYELALYLNLDILMEQLEAKAPVAMQLLHQIQRDAFPSYNDFKLAIIRSAMDKGAKRIRPDVLVCAFRQKFVSSSEGFNINHQCVYDEAEIHYGPWDARIKESLLMSCLEQDLKRDGFTIEPIDKRDYCTYFQGQKCPYFVFQISFSFDN